MRLALVGSVLPTPWVPRRSAPSRPSGADKKESAENQGSTDAKCIRPGRSGRPSDRAMIVANRHGLPFVPRQGSSLPV